MHQSPPKAEHSSRRTSPLTPRPAVSGWPSQEEGGDRKGGLRPLTVPGVPMHIPGCPQHCDTRKHQQHHQRSGPKCPGSWFPAARPQKLYPDGQEPWNQGDSHSLHSGLPAPCVPRSQPVLRALRREPGSERARPPSGQTPPTQAQLRPETAWLQDSQSLTLKAEF